MKISPEDHQRIADAVAKAESGTSGEIRCVLADRTAEPGALPVILASAAALIAPPIAFFLGLDPEGLAGMFGHWTIGHESVAGARIASSLTVYALLQTAIFLIVLGLCSIPALRRFFTPAGVIDSRVRDAAAAQFESLGLTYTRDRTGILLFASLEDHRAQVLADSGIYEKAPPKVWDEVVDLLVAGLRQGRPGDGFVAAVDRSGQVLSACLPPREDDRNELPDTLVETGRRGKRKVPPPST